MGDSKRNGQGKLPLTVLISFIFAGSYIADQYIGKSLLSLPLMGATLLSTSITAWGIPKLKALKFKQIIREEGPKKHHKKEGTPTMGGLLTIPVGLIIGNLIALNSTNQLQVLALTFLTLSFMLIGGFDDWRSLTQKTNTGLNPKGKIALQTIASLLFLTWAQSQEWINSQIRFFSDSSIDIGIFIWPLALFVLLAESNATNLTDGLDGLASGCGAMVFAGLGIELIMRGNESEPEIAGFCMAMAGAWLGFLIHNRRPARVFMGDTGSLPMGAALCGVALLFNSLWVLLIMGGIFLAESVSVIIQVWVFKLTKKLYGEGKRIFKMAPIHHHYELIGISEQTIVNHFWLVTLGLVLLGLLLRPNP